MPLEAQVCKNDGGNPVNQMENTMTKKQDQDQDHRPAEVTAAHWTAEVAPGVLDAVSERLAEAVHIEAVAALENDGTLSPGLQVRVINGVIVDNLQERIRREISTEIEARVTGKAREILDGLDGGTGREILNAFGELMQWAAYEFKTDKKERPETGDPFSKRDRKRFDQMESELKNLNADDDFFKDGSLFDDDFFKSEDNDDPA